MHDVQTKLFPCPQLRPFLAQLATTPEESSSDKPDSFAFSLTGLF